MSTGATRLTAGNLPMIILSGEWLFRKLGILASSISNLTLYLSNSKNTKICFHLAFHLVHPHNSNVHWVPLDGLSNLWILNLMLLLHQKRLARSRLSWSGPGCLQLAIKGVVPTLVVRSQCFFILVSNIALTASSPAQAWFDTQFQEALTHNNPAGNHYGITPMPYQITQNTSNIQELFMVFWCSHSNQNMYQQADPSEVSDLYMFIYTEA